MSGYLLDTNIISDVIRNPAGLAASRIDQAGSEKIFTSIIVAAELRYGCAKKNSSRLLTKVDLLLKTIPVLALNSPVDTEYGKIRAELEASGHPIGMNDLLIAAQAHALGFTLVTANTREFSRIRGLKIENWLA